MTGTDLRPFQVNHEFYEHINTGGIINWKQITGPIEHIERFLDPPYDFIISLSAIEHFGLGYYEGDQQGVRKDIVAMELAYKWLKSGGRFYLTVPVGVAKQTPHWRRYNQQGIDELIPLHWMQEFSCPYTMRVIETDPITKLSKYAPVAVSWEEAYASDDVGCLYEALFILSK